MTLIIGIKCSDGVVMGADSAATLGTATGLSTVIQHINKLHILQGHMVMGVSGQVGLAQLYLDQIDGLWKNKKLGINVDLPQVQREIRNAIYQDALPAMQAAQVSAPLLGPDRAFILANTASLIALPVGGPTGRPELVQFNHIGQAEAATSDLPYVAIGSGQQIADPFLAFLRRVFWPKTLPDLINGILAVTWTLIHVIDVNPGGVSEPIQLAVLEKSKGKELRARELTYQDIEEHRQDANDAEEYLKGFREGQHVEPSTPPNAPA